MKIFNLFKKADQEVPFEAPKEEPKKEGVETPQSSKIEPPKSSKPPPKPELKVVGELKFSDLKLFSEGQTIEDKPMMEVPIQKCFKDLQPIAKGMPVPIFLLQNAKNYEKMLGVFRSVYGDKVANWKLDII